MHPCTDAAMHPHVPMHPHAPMHTHAPMQDCGAQMLALDFVLSFTDNGTNPDVTYTAASQSLKLTNPITVCLYLRLRLLGNRYSRQPGKRWFHSDPGTSSGPA